MKFTSDHLSSKEIASKEDEMLVNDVLEENLLERWRKGQLSDEGLMDRLKAIRAINADHASTQLVDELNQEASELYCESGVA